MDTNKRILLIEDDKFIADLYQRTLKGADFEVDYAADGEVGMQKIKENAYDLILLDIMLPKKNGIQILQELSEQGGTTTPMMVLSNLGDEKIVEQCLQFGAIGFLIKASHTPHEVLSRVNEVLNHQ